MLENLHMYHDIYARKKIADKIATTLSMTESLAVSANTAPMKLKKLPLNYAPRSSGPGPSSIVWIE